MFFMRTLRRPIGLMVIMAMLSLGTAMPTYAAMLGTPEVIAADSTQQQKAYIKELLNRDEVRTQLIGMGVDPEQAQQRVDALTGEEVDTMVAQLEELPAGGDALGVLAFVLIVLLITDILGLTDVYNI